MHGVFCHVSEVSLETSILELTHTMNLIKNSRPVSNKTPDDRFVKLFIAIELEVKNEQFRLCFMS